MVRLWNIKDAKDGDVLAYDNGVVKIILLFKEWKNGHIGSANTYAHVFNNKININNWCDCGKMAHPATKEQRDTLMKAMADAGYTFDFEKKELIRLEKQGEQKPKWSDEDERIILSIEQVMNCASLLNIVPEKVDKIRTWLKSIKQRMGE